MRQLILGLVMAAAAGCSDPTSPPVEKGTAGGVGDAGGSGPDSSAGAERSDGGGNPAGGGVDLARVDLSTMISDLGHGASPDLAPSNPNCPAMRPALGAACGHTGVQCDWSYADGSHGFAFCDAYNRWASGSRDANCPSSPAGGSCTKFLGCDYQIGSPGDCIEQCECDTTVDRWICTSTCGCTSTSAEGPCPSSNGNVTESGTVPPNHGGSGGGYCPASTTAVCVKYRNIPMDCGYAEMSSTTTCTCVDDRWDCSTQ